MKVSLKAVFYVLKFPVIFLRSSLCYTDYSLLYSINYRPDRRKLFFFFIKFLNSQYYDNIIRGERYELLRLIMEEKIDQLDADKTHGPRTHEKMAWMLCYKALSISGLENRDCQKDRQFPQQSRRMKKKKNISRIFQSNSYLISEYSRIFPTLS